MTPAGDTPGGIRTRARSDAEIDPCLHAIERVELVFDPGHAGTAGHPTDVLRKSSGPIDLALRRRVQGDKDGVWPFPSSTVASAAFFSWSVSHVLDRKRWL